MSRMNMGIVVFASDKDEAKSVAEDKVNELCEDNPNKFFECGKVYDVCLLDSKKGKKNLVALFNEMKRIFIHAVNSIKLELQRDVNELWDGIGENYDFRLSCQDIGMYAGPSMRLYSEHFHNLRDQKVLDEYVHTEQKEQKSLTPFLVMACMSY